MIGLFDDLIPPENPAPPTERRRRIPASIRNNNPGAMWHVGGWQEDYGAGFGEKLNDGLRQGNQIAVFPDPESGAAAQFDLLDRYGAVPVRTAIAKWSGGNNVDSYLSMLRAAGFSPDENLAAILADPPRAAEFARTMARHEAGEDFPLDESGWASAYGKFRKVRYGEDAPPAISQPSTLGIFDDLIPSSGGGNSSQAPIAAGAPAPSSGLFDDLVPEKPKHVVYDPKEAEWPNDTTKVIPSKQSDWWDALNAFAGGIADSALAIPNGLYTQAAQITRRIAPNSEFAQGLADEYERLSDDFKQIRDDYSAFYHVDKAFQDSFTGKLIAAAGQMVPQTASAVLPGVGLAALQSQAFQYAWDDAEETAKERGYEFNPDRAFAYALTDSFQQALLEKVGLNAALGKWFKNGGERTLKQGLKRIATAALAEGITESGQGAGQDTLASVFGVEVRNPLNLARRGEEFAIGGILGGALRGVVEVGDRITDSRGKASEEKPATGLFDDLIPDRPTSDPDAAYKPGNTIPREEVPITQPTSDADLERMRQDLEGDDVLYSAMDGLMPEEDRAAQPQPGQPSPSGRVAEVNPAEQRAWESAIDAFVKDPNRNAQPLHLGYTPRVLIKLGLPDVKLSMRATDIAKVIGQSRDGHHITVDQLKSLPSHLANPIAVFRSDTHDNSVVVLTELQEAGSPVVSAIHIAQREGRIFVNRVASVYGKQRAKETFGKWISNGLLLYVSPEKGKDWFQSAGLQLPLEETSPAKQPNMSVTGVNTHISRSSNPDSRAPEGGALEQRYGPATLEEELSRLERDSQELTDRIARNAAKEPGVEQELRQKNPVRRGKEELLRRLEREASHGNLPREDAEAMRRFVSDLADDLISDVALTINMRGRGQGNYDFGTGIVRLFRENIEKGGDGFTPTFLHELWHSLSRYISPDDALAVRMQYLKEQAAYLRKNPWFKPFIGRWSMTPEQFAEWRKFANQDIADRHTREIKDDAGKVTGHALRFSSENYRFRDVDEWFAETLKDRTSAAYGDMPGPVQSVFQMAKRLLVSILRAIKQRFRPDVAQQIFERMMRADYEGKARSGPLQKWTDDEPNAATRFSDISSGEESRRRPVVKPILRVPVTTEKSLSGKRSWSVQNPIGDLSRFYMGTADIFERTPGLQFLGRAIRKHVDTQRRYYGEVTAPYRRWMRNHKAGERKQALKEFEAYWREEKRNPKLANDILRLASGAGQDLINLWMQTAKVTGAINQKNNVMVYDPEKRTFRPIGSVKNYFPRVMSQEALEVLQSPNKNPKAYRELVNEMLAEGIITDPKEADKYLDRVFNSYRANDHFGAIETARNLKLPNKAYDYSFETARRYMAAWSERMAQIEAFGQKVGKEGKDLFDVAQEMAGDEYTKNYIRAVADRAYNVRIDHPVARLASSLNTLATGLQLGNPATTMKNLISGLAFSGQSLGGRRTVAAMIDIRNTFRAIEDAHERGILADDLMNIMQDGEQTGASRKLQKFTSAALKVSGFEGSEQFLRGVNMVAARALLRDAIRANEKNPLSRRSLLYRGHFAKLGIKSPQALIDENGAGPLTDQYLRAAVNEVQGGYRYDQVPAFMDTPTGRFLFKYQKWGSQQLRHFHRNVVVPFIRFVPGGKRLIAEKVKVRDPKTGKIVTKDVPGQIMPMARYMIFLALAGAATEELLELIFGVPEKEASWGEIMATMNKDQRRALGMMAEKLFGYHLLAGSMGMLGNYLQMGMDFTQRSRFKNPLDPPGVSPLKGFADIALDYWEQGTLTAADFDNLARRQISLYRTGKQVAARANDVFGGDFRALQIESRRQDLWWLNGVTRRYNEMLGVQQNRTSFQRIGKNPNTPFRNALKNDLLLGDSAGARKRLNDWMRGIPANRRDDELTALMASVRASQPIRAGYGSEAMRVNFLSWAKEHLTASEVARIRDIDSTYRKTAIRLGLMKDQADISEDDLREAMRKIQARR